MSDAFDLRKYLETIQTSPGVDARNTARKAVIAEVERLSSLVFVLSEKHTQILQALNVEIARSVMLEVDLERAVLRLRNIASQIAEVSGNEKGEDE